ncbi:MAG: undecaprenyl-phosphate glucose phosphotransferase, partial [Bradyrhizobium sp.]
MTDLSDARLAKVPVNFGAFSFAFASLEAFAVAFEMIIVVLSSIIGGAAYHLFYYHTVYSNSFEGFLGIGVLAAILHMFVAKSQGLYHAQVLAGLDRRWSSLLGGWLLVVLLMTLIIFLLKVGSGVSRGSVMSFGLIGGLGLVAGRMLLQAPLQRAIDRGMLATRRAVVVGMADELSRVRQSSLLCDFGLSEVRR